MRHGGSVPALDVEEIDDRGPLAKHAITIMYDRETRSKHNLIVFNLLTNHNVYA